MSALFSINVDRVNYEKGESFFSIKIINPDQTKFYSSKSFALMLLTEPIREYKIKSAPVLNEIPLDDILKFNTGIIHEKQGKIISASEIQSTRNWPLPENLKNLPDGQIRKFWNNKGHLPEMHLKITVSKPEFMLHLKKNMKWESGAYDLN